MGRRVVRSCRKCEFKGHTSHLCTGMFEFVPYARIVCRALCVCAVHACMSVRVCLKFRKQTVQELFSSSVCCRKCEFKVHMSHLFAGVFEFVLCACVACCALCVCAVHAWFSARVCLEFGNVFGNCLVGPYVARSCRKFDFKANDQFENMCSWGVRVCAVSSRRVLCVRERACARARVRTVVCRSCRLVFGARRAVVRRCLLSTVSTSRSRGNHG